MRLVFLKNQDVLRFEGLPARSADGGYPLFHVTPFCDVLCSTCAREREKHHAGYAAPSPRELPCQSVVNWESLDLYCDDCGERIKSAYAEPEEEN